MYWSNFEYFHLFQRYSKPKFEVVRKRVKFFWLSNFFLGGRPPKFWTGIIKFSLVLITVQNFAPIGRRISEISRWNKNKKFELMLTRRAKAYSSFC